MTVVRHLIYFTLLLHCLSEIMCGNIHDFIVNLPSTIGQSVSTAWTDFINAIKTPVRLRRRRKKKRQHASFTSTTPTMEFSEVPFTEPSVLTKMSNNIRPTIPVFYQPEWTRWLDWKAFERPSLLEIIEKMRHFRTSSTEKDQLYEGAMLKRQSVAEENDEHLFVKKKNSIKKTYENLNVAGFDTAPLGIRPNNALGGIESTVQAYYVSFLSYLTVLTMELNEINVNPKWQSQENGEL